MLPNSSHSARQPAAGGTGFISNGAMMSGDPFFVVGHFYRSPTGSVCRILSVPTGSFSLFLCRWLDSSVRLHPCELVWSGRDSLHLLNQREMNRCQVVDTKKRFTEIQATGGGKAQITYFAEREQLPSGVIIEPTHDRKAFLWTIPTPPTPSPHTHTHHHQPQPNQPITQNRPNTHQTTTNETKNQPVYDTYPITRTPIHPPAFDSPAPSSFISQSIEYFVGSIVLDAQNKQVYTITRIYPPPTPQSDLQQLEMQRWPKPESESSKPHPKQLIWPAGKRRKLTLRDFRCVPCEVVVWPDWQDRHNTGGNMDRVFFVKLPSNGTESTPASYSQWKASLAAFKPTRRVTPTQNTEQTNGAAPVATTAHTPAATTNNSMAITANVATPSPSPYAATIPAAPTAVAATAAAAASSPQPDSTRLESVPPLPIVPSLAMAAPSADAAGSTYPPILLKDGLTRMGRSRISLKTGKPRRYFGAFMRDGHTYCVGSYCRTSNGTVSRIESIFALEDEEVKITLQRLLHVSAIQAWRPDTSIQPHALERFWNQSRNGNWDCMITTPLLTTKMQPCEVLRHKDFQKRNSASSNDAAANASKQRVFFVREEWCPDTTTLKPFQKDLLTLHVDPTLAQLILNPFNTKTSPPDSAADVTAAAPSASQSPSSASSSPSAAAPVESTSNSVWTDVEDQILSGLLHTFRTVFSLPHAIKHLRHAILSQIPQLASLRLTHSDVDIRARIDHIGRRLEAVSSLQADLVLVRRQLSDLQAECDQLRTEKAALEKRQIELELQVELGQSNDQLQIALAMQQKATAEEALAAQEQRAMAAESAAREAESSRAALAAELTRVQDHANAHLSSSRLEWSARLDSLSSDLVASRTAEDSVRERLIVVKTEKLDLLDRVEETTVQVEREKAARERAESLKRKAEDEAEEQKVHHERRIAEHRAEQLQLAERLENEQLRVTCSACMDGTVNYVYQPCGHATLCDSCDQRLPSRVCPKCQTKIRTKYRLFI